MLFGCSRDFTYFDVFATNSTVLSTASFPGSRPSSRRETCTSLKCGSRGERDEGRKGMIYSAERNWTKSAGDKARTKSSRISFSFSASLVAYFSRNETKLIPSTAGSNHAHRSSQLYHGRSSFSLFSPRGALLFFPRNISPSSGQGFDTRKVVEKRVKDATLREHRGQLGRLEEP